MLQLRLIVLVHLGLALEVATHVFIDVLVDLERILVQVVLLVHLLRNVVLEDLVLCHQLGGVVMATTGAVLLGWNNHAVVHALQIPEPVLAVVL